MTITHTRTRIHTTDLATPVGSFTVAVRDGAVVGLGWTDHFHRVEAHLTRRFGDTERVAVEPAELPEAAPVADYLDGDLDAIDRALTDTGGTDFQHHVWATLRKIPAGETWTYAELADAVGRPTAFRAVGNANGANPISLIHPCHRVVATGGSLGGYSGGLDRKDWLLRHEGVLL